MCSRFVDCNGLFLLKSDMFDGANQKISVEKKHSNWTCNVQQAGNFLAACFFLKTICKQECIPVRCVPLSLPPYRGSPWQRPPRQRPPWTETPLNRVSPPRQRHPIWTEIPLNRDPSGHNPPGQRRLWTEIPWTETSLDRDRPCPVDRKTPVKTLTSFASAKYEVEKFPPPCSLLGHLVRCWKVYPCLIFILNLTLIFQWRRD